MVDITSTQTESERGGCIVHYSWNLPGNIWYPKDILQYLVVFNGTYRRIYNTGNYYTIEMHQSVCSCGSHDIVITAVDKCGRNGRSQTHTVAWVSDAMCV